MAIIYQLSMNLWQLDLVLKTTHHAKQFSVKYLNKHINWPLKENSFYTYSMGGPTQKSPQKG